MVKKCIESWKRNLSDYQIIEWNETNFNIKTNEYVRQAYDSGKFAFVSDYVRAYVLYNYGGIYLDTDVEVLQSLDKFLNHESFWGFEEKNYIATSTIGSKKGNGLIKKFLDFYSGRRFILEDGSFDMLTNVAVVSQMTKEFGVKLNGTYQEIDGIGVFYPQEYFSPYDYINCYSKVDENSYTIHYFYKSWLPFKVRVFSKIKKIISDMTGGKGVRVLRKIIGKKIKYE